MRHGYTAIAALALLGVIGCTDASERTLGYRDEKITADVETALRANIPGTIQVVTRDRVVTLSGTVPDTTARDKATDIATKTAGVAQVKNELRASIAADAPAGLPPANRGGVPPGNRPPAPELQ